MDSFLLDTKVSGLGAETPFLLLNAFNVCLQLPLRMCEYSGMEVWWFGEENGATVLMRWPNICVD